MHGRRCWSTKQQERYSPLQLHGLQLAHASSCGDAGRRRPQRDEAAACRSDFTKTLSARRRAAKPHIAGAMALAAPSLTHAHRARSQMLAHEAHTFDRPKAIRRHICVTSLRVTSLSLHLGKPRSTPAPPPSRNNFFSSVRPLSARIQRTGENMSAVQKLASADNRYPEGYILSRYKESMHCHSV